MLDAAQHPLLFNACTYHSICRGCAISRVMENKHHPSDIVGGAALGTVIGILFSAHALLRHARIMAVAEAAPETRPVDDGLQA